MIARLWHGRVPTSKSDEYLRLMRTIAIPDYKSTLGNRGAWALRQIQGEITHFVMLTFWESREAIARFAGNDIGAAKYYDFDHDFLLELEPHVKHFDLYDDAQ
jgi:heme-degrading monooxygenase HmoA